MQTKDLQKKSALRFALMALMIGVAGLAKSYAEHVEPEKAKKVAATFLSNNGAKSDQLTDLSTKAGFPNLYIFNAEQGFVVMAADDRVKPILGYSLTGKFVVENMPENLRWWLQGYNDEIQCAIDNQLRASTKVAQEWEDFAKGRPSVGQRSVVVEPLIDTEWGQDEPYNLQCPNGYPTGCVATAMAQIMKKWNYPEQGQGSHTNYNNSNQTVNFSETTYDWSNMTNTYDSSSTEEQKQAVAMLMFHCGVSVDMNYGPQGSSTSDIKASIALKEYFRYANDARFARRNNIGHDAVWKSIMKGELDAGRPMLYGGDNNKTGNEKDSHAFVCDGYDSDDCFHFNWGWDGTNQNMFFSIDIMTPGNPNNHNYSNNQDMVYGIRPSNIGCDAPTNIAGSLNGRDVTLSWTAVAGVDSYRIYRNGVLIEASATGTTYTDSNLAGGSYQYYIRSNCVECGTSAPSNILVVEITLFTISATANPSSGGMVSGAGAYYENSECTLTAIPNPHYAFTNWTKNGVQVSTESTYTFNVTETASYTANFDALTAHTITCNSVEHGTISASATTAYMGETITLYPSPFIGLSEWIVKGANNHPITVTNNQFTMPDSNVTVSAVFTQLPTVAIGNLWYCLNDNTLTAEVRGCNYDSGTLTIPSSVTHTNENNQTHTYSVVSIGNSAFRDCSGFTGSLAIPNSVTSIGSYALYGCNGLTGSLTIGNSVTSIGTAAFYGCSGFIGSLTIPNSVTSIGNSAFYGCNFSGLYIDMTNIPNSAFSYCSGFTGNLTIGNSVTTIGNSAFYNCSGFTGSLTIPNSVTSIGSYAFSGCSGLTGSLTIPNSVNTIGYLAFPGNSTGLYIDMTNIPNSAFSGRSGFTGSLTIGNSVISIGEDAFYNCSGFTSLAIGNSVILIGKDAFEDCSGFTGSLTIPNSVISIGEDAFYNCSGFTGSLVIPNSVTSIGGGAFSGCSGFTGSLAIPNSVTSIGGGAFSGCSGFTGSLAIPNSVTSIGGGAFSGCSGFTGSLTIPNSVTSIGYGAFKNCSGFTGTLTIPNSVTSIGGSAFENCSGFIGTLTIPNSVTSIGNLTFYNCSGFTEVHFNASNCADLNPLFSPFWGCNCTLTIGDNLERIPAYVFYASGFTGSLTIPNSVTSIGEGAFRGCHGFTGSLIIPNSVTSIGSVAFMDCSGFTGSLTIPNSVISIGSGAFYGCSGLTGSLTIPNSVTLINDQTFENCSGLTGSLTIPNSVTKIGWRAFYGCSGFTGSLFIPNSVTSISNTAFEGCSGFTGSLTIPNSVASIGNWAFYNCSGFTGSLTIGNSVTSIGKESFWNCSGFSGDLSIPNSVTSIGESAFASCSGFSSIHSYGAVPPTTDNNAFEGTNYSIPVYVPLCSATDYAGASQWSNFTDYQAVLPCPYTFTGNGTDNLWSNPDNWHTLPTNDYDIIINANCEMDEDVEASGVIINNTGTLIIKSGHVLTINGGNNRSGEALLGEIVNHGTAANLIIEDGGQLVYDKSGLQGTVQKAISPYTQNGNDGWHLLAYPLTGNGTVAGQENMLSNDYDLYYYDEPTHYWMNYKDSENGFNQLEAGKGYLYANSGIIPYHGFDQAEYVTNPGAIYGYDASVLQGSQSIYGVNVKHESGYRLGEDFTMLDNATIQSIEVFGYQTGSTTTSTFTGMYIQIYDGNPMEGGQPIWGNMDDNIITATSWTGCYRCNYNLGTTRPIMSIKAENLNIPLEAGTYYLTWNLSGSASSGPWGVPVAIQGVSNTGDGLQYSGDTWNYYLDSGSQMGIGFAFKITWLLEAGTVDDVELSFAGELENGSATINIPLSYTESAGQLKGFNLVGNPFVHNVTNYGSTNVAEGCYRMNETKDNLIVSEIDEENPLKPAEGFFVKATDEGASITFNPGRSETASRSGSIRVELLDNGKLIDRLIVKMDGEPLEKLSLKEQRTKLFATQDHQEIAIVPCVGNEQPINFKAAKNGEYTINVNTNGLEFNYLHLIDNLIGSDVDLVPLLRGEGGLNEPRQATYTFEAKTSDYASRFKLVFSVCGDAYGDDAPFAFISNGNIIVTADAGDASLQVIDMLGRVIRTVGLSQCGSRTTTAGMTKGVYVLRLIKGEKVRTQKIVID